MKMKKEDKKRAIADIKASMNAPKDRLISAMNELMDFGAVREAKALETIIIKLEAWQNK